MEHYYFGCNTQAGHHLRTSMNGNLETLDYKKCAQLEFYTNNFDGAYPPHDTNMQGVVKVSRLTLKKNWTIFAFWDYSIDSRPGSHSTFIFSGLHNYDECVDIIREHYPTVLKRIDTLVPP